MTIPTMNGVNLPGKVFDVREDDIDYFEQLLHGPSWKDEGLCVSEDIQVFFPRVGRNTDKAAKDICAQCPVAQECLQYSVDNEIDHGVWGGMNGKDRAPLIKEHRKQRQLVEFLCRHPRTAENTNQYNQCITCRKARMTTPLHRQNNSDAQKRFREKKIITEVEVAQIRRKRHKQQKEQA